MTFAYGAYGLNIRSDVAIDFLTPIKADARIDLDICFRPDGDLEADLKARPWEMTYPPSEIPYHGIEISQFKEQLKLLFRRDADSALEFVISKDAKQTTLLRTNQLPEIDAISFFIGPVCGVVSRLRMKTCLHASVLALNGRAFALTGEKRAGKSTTSAILTKCGAKLIADDIAVLNHKNGGFWVEPAYPFMRLAPPAIELAGRSMDETFELLSVGNKRYLPVKKVGGNVFPLSPQPLDAIYILSQRQAAGTDISIEQLEPNKAARVLNSNGYGKYVMDAAMRRQDFSLYAKFAREKHSRAITRPNDLSRLAELGDKILDDFRKIHG